jgi:transposase-like protein
MPRLKGSADLLEDRRKRALALLDSGYSLNQVGRRIGCHASSVMRWRDARRRGGDQGLRVRCSPGRPLKLDPAKRNSAPSCFSIVDTPQLPKVNRKSSSSWLVRCLFSLS